MPLRVAMLVRAGTTSAQGFAPRIPLRVALLVRAGTVGPFSIAPAPHRFPGTSAAPDNFSTLSPAADTARATARN